MTRYLTPLLFGLAGTAVLVWLGLWQMDRLAWKQGVLAEIDARIAASPVGLPDTPDAERDKYLPVAVTGQFGDGALRVLVSQKRVGAGYLIISPFTTQAGRSMLVDRGFLKLETPLPEAPSGTITIEGNLHWPDDRNSSTPENDIDDNTWFARDIAQMADTFGTEPTLLVARQITPPEQAISPLPVDTENIPNDHLQYAVTWFLLAIVWVVMTGYYMFRTNRASKGNA